MRTLVGIVVILSIVAGLFSYLVLPGMIESRLAESLQESYGLQTEPEVEVSSDFPPELLLGRVDRIQVRADRIRREGLDLRNVRADLKGVDASVPSFLRGSLKTKTQSGSLRAEVTAEAINQYLESHSDLGANGQANIDPQGLVYESSATLLPSVRLDVRVAGPQSIVVSRARAGALTTVDLGELPFGARLQSVKPSTGKLTVRAGNRITSVS